jgi:serine/threonine protein kinase
VSACSTSVTASECTERIRSCTSFVGTMTYMSPERLTGNSYSLTYADVCWRMLTYADVC